MASISSRARATVVAAAVALGVGGVFIGSSGSLHHPVATPTPSGNQTANIWVVPDSTASNTCTRASTAETLTAAKAANRVCDPDDDVTNGVLNAAYAEVQVGDTIGMECGEYAVPSSEATIEERALSTPVVTIRPDTDCSVEVLGNTNDATQSGVRVDARNLVIDGGDTLGEDDDNRIFVRNGLDFQDSTRPDDHNILVEDVHAEGTFISADDVTWRYSEIGPNRVCDFAATGNVRGDMLNIDSFQEPHPRRVKIHFNWLHDNYSGPCEGPLGLHADLMTVVAPEEFEFIGNHVAHCGTQCILVDGSTTPDSYRIESNMVQEGGGENECTGCGGPLEFQIDTGCTNTGGQCLIQYNTSDGGIGTSGTGSGTILRGNVWLEGQTCETWTQDGDIFDSVNGSACGTNSTRCDPTLLNATTTTADFHLASGDDCAKDAGDADNFPVYDVDEQLRPLGTIDAGADEIP